MLDEAELGRLVGSVVRDAVAQATTDLLVKVANLEQRVAEMPTSYLSQEELDVAVQRKVDLIEFPKAIKGDDGKSVTLDEVRPVLEAEVARWALDFERRAAGVLERAVDRLPKPESPKPGKDGADGLDLKSLEVELDADGRTIVFKMADAERTKEWRLTPPIMLDAGLFDDAKNYTKGDAVTWNGAMWIAQTAQPVGKPGESVDWRLSVKRGREGKAGDPGKPGLKGLPGKDGRDLTQIGPDGSKW